MAQTTGAIPKSNFQVEISTNGITWIDISRAATTVTPSGGEQQTGEQFTAEGTVPVVIGANKISATTLEVNILYTETGAEPFQTVYGRYTGVDKSIFLRYAPKGLGSGNKRYVCTNNANSPIAVPIISCLPPEVDAGTGDPAMASFSVMTPKLFQETMA